jgi:hypothetical protein
MDNRENQGAKYALMTLAMMGGFAVFYQIGNAPREWSGYLLLVGIGVCFWIIRAIDRNKGIWVQTWRMPFPLKGRIETRGFFAGLGVNCASILVFLIAASRLTAKSPVSTYVLTYTPLLEGGLVALTVLWAAQYLRRVGHKNGFAAGLMFGIPSQIGCFAVWHLWWVQIYAG